jgi:hypothetical protein
MLPTKLLYEFNTKQADEIEAEKTGNSAQSLKAWN